MALPHRRRPKSVGSLHLRKDLYTPVNLDLRCQLEAIGVSGQERPRDSRARKAEQGKVVRAL